MDGKLNTNSSVKGNTSCMLHFGETVLAIHLFIDLISLRVSGSAINQLFTLT